ncbi:MAG: hypothetical protein H7A38_03130 [Chlamydiales bacterium]|nr:hypothetical protein [Chlamydiales bacterium]
MLYGSELPFKSIAPALATAPLFYMGARYGKIEGAAKGTLFVALAALARGIHEKGCYITGRTFCKDYDIYYDGASVGLIALGMVAIKTSFKTRLVIGALLFGTQKYLEIVNRNPNMVSLIKNATKDNIDETITRIETSFGEGFSRDNPLISYVRYKYFKRMKKLFTKEELKNFYNNPTSTYSTYSQEHEKYKYACHKHSNIKDCIDILNYLDLFNLALFQNLEVGDERDRAKIAEYMEKEGNLIKAWWKGLGALKNATKATCDTVMNQASKSVEQFLKPGNTHLCHLRWNYFEKMEELFTKEELKERMINPESTLSEQYTAYRKSANTLLLIKNCIYLLDRLDLADLSLFKALEEVDEKDQAEVAKYMQEKGNLIKARWEK